MNKPLLTLGIILSLGTAGCAGFGVQQSSSLSGQFKKQPGLDGLWSATERAPTQGLETPRYADQSLGDLWNPAFVARSWETDPGETETPSRSLLFGDSSGGGIWY